MLPKVTWTLSFYSDHLKAELHALPAGHLARFLRYAEKMEIVSPDLGMPHTRAMGDGLFELRLKATEGIARVFYCTVVDRKIIFLHQFVKKSNKTPTRELRIARSRLREVKHG